MPAESRAAETGTGLRPDRWVQTDIEEDPGGPPRRQRTLKVSVAKPPLTCAQEGVGWHELDVGAGERLCDMTPVHGRPVEIAQVVEDQRLGSRYRQLERVGGVDVEAPEPIGQGYRDTLGLGCKGLGLANAGGTVP